MSITRQNKSGMVLPPYASWANHNGVNPAPGAPNPAQRDWQGALGSQSSSVTNIGPNTQGGYMPVPIATDVTTLTQGFMAQQLHREEVARREREAIPIHARPGANMGLKTPNPAVEDIVGADINAQQRYEVSHEPIFRPTYFVANSKYCQMPSQPQNFLLWNITTNTDGQTGNIIADDDAMQSIVSVSLDSFTIPASMLTSTDAFFGLIQVHLNAFPSSKSALYDYSGAATKVVASMYHFDCAIQSDSANATYIATPIERVFHFPVPTGLTGGQWRVSFRRPMLNGTLTVPAAVIYGTSGTPTAGTLIINAPGHHVVNGYLVTIDTDSLATTYVPYNVGYVATVIDANNFSLPVDSLSITSGTALTLGILNNTIILRFRIMAIDKRADLISSTRVMTIAS